LFGELLPQAADAFRITETESMGPRFHEDDSGVYGTAALYFAPAFCA
jgi:hypothetical protein